MSTENRQSEAETRLRDFLRRPERRTGEKLPGERELASTLGVGRTALRPALEQMEVEGVLRRQPQSGTYLAAIPLPAGRGLSVTLVAPLQGTGDPDRASEYVWLSRVVSAFERTAVPAGIRLGVIDQSPRAADPCSVADVAREAAGAGARAVVLVHPLGTRAKIAHALAILHDLGVHPLIVSARTYPGLASQVYFDGGWGAYLATRHLLQQGHTRIGFAGAARGHEWAQERLAAYRGALEAADIVPDGRWVWLAEDSERLPAAQDGTSAFDAWRALSPETRPTAIVAANDTVALGVLAAARAQGTAVPGQLSLIGFDNDPGALLAGLTTVERPTEALGEAVARTVLERLAAGPEAGTVTVRLRPILIERATVGPPPDAAVTGMKGTDVMNPSCLHYRLTEEERRTFEETGLLTVENALTPEQIAALTERTDRIYERQVAQGHDARTALFYPNFIPDDPLFAGLVDHEKVLPKVWGLLGWNIYLYHAHMIVTPPSGKSRDDQTFGWHQDSGRVNQEMESHPRPRLSFKVAYFLSDTSAEGRGNFWVIPGSHLRDDLPRPAGGVGQPAGAVPVLAKPGTAVFFDRRLWHTASPNWSDVTRKILFYGYGYRWLRTKDDMTVRDLWETSDPIRRQMLGWGTGANGYYSPADEDVPLRVWLREHSPEEAK